MVKGVMRVDDARRARDAGFTGLSVSNHGGNNLDGTPSPLRALPAIAEAVGSEIDVLLDGGVRRGSDVIKAVALGARAVRAALANLLREHLRAAALTAARAGWRRLRGGAGACGAQRGLKQQRGLLVDAGEGAASGE